MRTEDWFRHLESKDLAGLGINDVAYIRETEIDGRMMFAVHAADGTRVAVLPSRDVAMATIVQHDLQPMSLH